MSFEIKEIEYCRLNVTYEAEPEQVEDKRSEIVQYFKKSAVPGFRSGKAPLKAVKLHFKHKIDELTKNELAQNAFHQAIAEKNIRPFGQPQFLSIKLDGDNFKCNFCVNKVPEVELAEYKGFELTKGHIPDSVEMAERILQELRVRNGDTLPFTDEDFLQTNDNAIITYKGFIEGQQDPVINAEGEMFIVGKAHIDDFNTNLLGMKTGEKRDFIVNMPENASAQQIAGKMVKFEVELSMASKSNPAPLDDTFAQKVGVNTVAELMDTIKGTASVRSQELEKKHLTNQIAARLVQNHNLEIPVWLSSFEAELLAKQYGYSWNELGDEQKQKFIDNANENIKLSIILDKIRETEPEAQMSDEEVFQIIKSNIGLYKKGIPDLENKTDEEAFEYISSSGLIPSLVSHVKDDFTIDFIAKNSNIVE